MKIIFFCIAITFSFLLITTPVSALDVQNNSFENAEENWIKTVSTVQLAINTSDTKESSHSAEISYTSTTSNGIKQSISPIMPEQMYKISGYIKVTTAKKAYLRIAWYQSGSSNQIKTDDSLIQTASTEWVYVDFIATAPLNSTNAEIRLLVSEGTALFDNIKIETYTLPTTSSTPTVTYIPVPTNILQSISPTIPTLSPTLPSTYDQIYLSEVFVYPDNTAYEWVELYNANNYSVNLNNWFIDDIEDGGSTPKMFNSTVAPLSYIVIEMNTALFNNLGDSVRLLDANKQQKDSISYTGSQQNKSIARVIFSSPAVCIQTPSKGTANNTCINTLDEEITPSTTPIPTLIPIATPTLTPTVYIIKRPSILGVHTQSPFSQKKTHSTQSKKLDNFANKIIITSHTHPPALSFIATGYSLLSFLSIAAKIIITRH